VILLDTNAIIWLQIGHPRTRSLARLSQPLHVSPASMLELQFLVEAGRLRLAADLVQIAAAMGWLVDDPPAAAWFEAATDLGWTRDPFDRLLVAHAQLRGWRFATGDAAIIAQLGVRRALAL
jgi:PIN domain nuclease of toxin-antitoxin system